MCSPLFHLYIRKGRKNCFIVRGDSKVIDPVEVGLRLSRLRSMGNLR